MELTKFRVTDFKSIKDSGFVTCEKITTLIGVNEAGKSNLLLALWKFNPAREGNLNFTSDMPVTRVAEYRKDPENHWFIEAYFKINEEDSSLSKLLELGYQSEQIKEFSVKRNYSGEYDINFHNFQFDNNKIYNKFKSLLDTFFKTIEDIDEAGKGEKDINFKSQILEKIKTAQSSIYENRDAQNLLKQINFLESLPVSKMASSKLNPEVISLKEQLSNIKSDLSITHPNNNKEVKKIIVDNLPKFVYYANYGNLDSEIYLPRVISDFNSTRQISEKELAKQRTLKVLFEYVSLDPDEILDMGQHDYKIKDQYNRIQELSDEQINEGMEKTKEREILLNSASTNLTREFRNWWKQGNYIFDLRADGDYFRIWVSDDRRPEKISLEDRSTGLQWFLSFFMVFLVESGDSHKDCILLLDEAGTTLHPKAQKDLLNFFENLSDKNQILTTTHSPFLVDVDNLERTKVVYVDKDGYTAVSDDLRAGEKSKTATGAVYAVHAALGLSISEGMLNGCNMVIVEGASDQYYLNAIKQYLIGKKLINPPREIIFMPAGGVKTVKQLISLVAGKQEILPIVVLDSDKSGEIYKNKLQSDIYRGQENRILTISDFTKKNGSEVEDLIPSNILERSVEFLINNREFRFANEYDDQLPVIGQIEKWASEYGIALEHGYKVDLAKDVKSELNLGKHIIEPERLEQWTELFNIIDTEQDLN